MAKFIVVGRHKFTSRQLKLLEMARLTEEAARIEQVDNVNTVIAKAKEVGAEAIVVQALPMPLLAQLLQVASRVSIPVYGFKVAAVALAKDAEEAKKIAEKADADIIIPSREGTFRISKTITLQRLKRIVVESEDVVSLP